jgi:hypothetical protein
MPSYSVPRVESTKRNVQNYFAKDATRDERFRQEQEKLRAADAAKTAKLRALRLARDADEAAAAKNRTETDKSNARRKPRRVRASAVVGTKR